MPTSQRITVLVKLLLHINVTNPMNNTDVYNEVSYAIFDILRNLTTPKKFGKEFCTWLIGIVHNVRFRFQVSRILIVMRMTHCKCDNWNPHLIQEDRSNFIFITGLMIFLKMCIETAFARLLYKRKLLYTICCWTITWICLWSMIHLVVDYEINLLMSYDTLVVWLW